MCEVVSVIEDAQISCMELWEEHRSAAWAACSRNTWGGVSQAKQRMKTQMACGLNSESKEGVVQAEVGEAGPEPGQPHMECVLPQCKGVFETEEVGIR